MTNIENGKYTRGPWRLSGKSFEDGTPYFTLEAGRGTGNGAHAATTGNFANAATTGDYAHAATTGEGAHAVATGKNAVAVAIGAHSRAKSNTAIVLAAYDGGGNLVAVFASRVGENGIEPGVSYRLRTDGTVARVDPE